MLDKITDAVILLLGERARSAVAMAEAINTDERFKPLRDHAHAQYEIRVFALAMMELTASIVPISVAAYRGETGKA